MVGAVFTMVVSVACSAIFGFNDATSISPELITPMLRKIIFKPHSAVQNKNSLSTTVNTEF